MRVLISLLLFLGGPFANAQTWILDPAQSSLTLTAQVYGAPFEAEFTKFDADIVFDPDNLEMANVMANIDLAALTPAIADDAIYISELQGADWFFSSKFPQAIFQSQGFADLGGGNYQVDGTLKIRDQAAPLSFKFQLEIDGNQADMTANFLVNRFDLGLGLGTHPNEGTVNPEVAMKLQIVASKQ